MDRKKMMTSATTNSSTVPTGTKHKRKRKATTNGTMRKQPARCQEVLPPRCTTIDGSTATTDMNHKRKKKKKKAMTNATAMATVTNQPVGGQEALPPQQAMPCGGSTVTTINSTTAAMMVRRDESVGGQEAFPPRLTTTNNASTGKSTGKKRRRTKKKKKKKTTTTTKGTATTTITTTKGGKKLITLKLREGLVNNKPGVLPRTARLSEAAAHQYFVEKFGLSNVEWVNQDRESGLPYDIVITRGGVSEYVEVKEQMAPAPGEKGFTIQPSEWQFLCQKPKRNSSSIALVKFPSTEEAAIVILRNPRRLCKNRSDDLFLALVMSEVLMLMLGRFAAFSLLPQPAQEHGSGNGIAAVAPVKKPKTHHSRTLEDPAAALAGLLQLWSWSSIGKPGEESSGDGRSLSRPGKTGEASDYGSRIMITGRLGEAAVYQYLIEKHGAAGNNVSWVNRRRESGLPCDIVVTKKGGAREYVEVKTTVHPDKNWFPISEREWKFVEEKGASLSIARVFLQGENSASIVMLEDPRRLCEQQDLNLSLFMR